MSSWIPEFQTPSTKAETQCNIGAKHFHPKCRCFCSLRPQVCAESLDAFNARRSAAGQLPVAMDRWRPNLVVSCGAPHVEDAWRTVRVGAATLRVTGPCPRCTVPDVQQQTGIRDTAQLGPMKTLREYRSQGAGVLFGIYLTPVTPGVTVRLGDPVQGLP